MNKQIKAVYEKLKKLTFIQQIKLAFISFFTVFITGLTLLIYFHEDIIKTETIVRTVPYAVVPEIIKVYTFIIRDTLFLPRKNKSNLKKTNKKKIKRNKFPKHY